LDTNRAFRKYLAHHGIEVTILTVKQRLQPQVEGRLDRPEFEEGVERTAAVGPVRVLDRARDERLIAGLARRGWYLIKRLLSLGLFPDEYVGWVPFAVRRGVRLHGVRPFDLILSSGPPWSSFVVGTILSERLGIPHVADYRDPWTVHEPGKFPSRLIRRLSVRYERRMVERAAMILANTEAARELLSQAFGPEINRKVRVVRNGYDPEVYERVAREDRLAEAQTGASKFRLVHAGLFYSTRHMGPLLRAMHRLRAEGVISPERFELISYGALLKADRFLVRELQLQGMVSEQPYLPYNALLGELRRSTMNLLVIGASHWPQVPAKLYDYLMAERPMFCIGPLRAEARAMVLAHGYGAYADVDSEQEVVERLREAVGDHARGALNEARLSVPPEYSIVNQVERLAGAVRGIVAARYSRSGGADAPDK
jgi:glycosyltransferase involved in cell wall biosynthesis